MIAVKETTICKCFRKAGILDSTLNVVSCDLVMKTPFIAADESMALQGLIDEAMTVSTLNGEDDVPVCLDACSDTWEEEFFDNLGQQDQGEEDSDNEQPSPEFEPPPSKIRVIKKQYCHWKKFNFSLNLESVFKMLCKWGILWTIYLLYR